MGALSHSSPASVCPCMRLALQGSLDALKMVVCLSNRSISAFIVLQYLYNPTALTASARNKQVWICVLVGVLPAFVARGQPEHPLCVYVVNVEGCHSVFPPGESCATWQGISFNRTCRNSWPKQLWGSLGIAHNASLSHSGEAKLKIWANREMPSSLAQFCGCSCWRP